MTAAGGAELPRFVFARLTNDDAVDLGLVAVAVVRERALNLAIEVRLNDVVAFHAKLRDTDASNEVWLAGKAAVARHFSEPSLHVRLRHTEAGTPFEDRADFDHDLFKAYGGSIPLWVDSTVVGTFTVSGEPDEVDHDVAMECLHRYLATTEG